MPASTSSRTPSSNPDAAARRNVPEAAECTRCGGNRPLRRHQSGRITLNADRRIPQSRTQPGGTTLEPVRTCLGCRQRDARSSLSRFVARDGEVVADAAAAAPGRGAWVHATPECLESALKRRAFGRALRADGPLRTDQVLTTISQLTEQAERHMDN